MIQLPVAIHLVWGTTITELIVPFACRLAGGPFTGFCCITGGLVMGGWMDGEGVVKLFAGGGDVIGAGWNCCCCWGGDEKLFAGGGDVIGAGWNCCCCWGGDEKLFAGGGDVIGAGWNCCCCWGGDEKLLAGGGDEKLLAGGGCVGGVPNGLKL